MNETESLKKMKDAEHRISSYIHKIGKISQEVNKLDNGKPFVDQDIEVRALHEERLRLIGAIYHCAAYVSTVASNLFDDEKTKLDNDHYEQLEDAGLSIEKHEVKEEEE